MGKSEFSVSKFHQKINDENVAVLIKTARDILSEQDYAKLKNNIKSITKQEVDQGLS